MACAGRDRRRLEEADISVIQAGEAQEALALLSQVDRLDLRVFTDIKLPGRLSGWDIAEEARIRMPDLPIIYATGFNEGRERQLGRSYCRALRPEATAPGGAGVGGYNDSGPQAPPICAHSRHPDGCDGVWLCGEVGSMCRRRRRRRRRSCRR